MEKIKRKKLLLNLPDILVQLLDEEAGRQQIDRTALIDKLLKRGLYLIAAERDEEAGFFMRKNNADTRITFVDMPRAMTQKAPEKAGQSAILA